MKINLLIILIIFASLISGALGSYFFLNFTDMNLLSLDDNTIKIDETIVQDWKITNITNLQSEVTSLVDNLWESVVNIIISKDIDQFKRDPWWFFAPEKVWTVEQKVWWWSGFFVRTDGTILTNKHVVSDQSAKYTVITNTWEEYSASVVALDPMTDLAIIKVDEDDVKFKPLDIIWDVDSINIWQFAIAIWNALWEFQNSVSFWVVSGKNRSIVAGWNGIQAENLSGLLQTDARINPWNSGWPLISLNWEVIGINTAISGQWQWLGFSIPLSKKRVEYILDSIERNWEIKRPFIWVSYLMVTPDITREYGLDVDYWAFLSDKNSVVVGSPAHKAGLEMWDVILKVDWVDVIWTSRDNSWVTINSLIQNKIPWDNVKLQVLKSNWGLKEINIELSEL